MKRRILTLGVFCAALAWPQAEFRTGQAARALIGQPTFTKQLPGVTGTTFPASRLLGASGGLTFVNDKLIVADSSRVGAEPDNRRVLIFDNISRDVPALTAEVPQGGAFGRCPICVGEADVVLGQADFTPRDQNLPVNPAPSATNLRGPNAVHSDGNVLVIADTDYNRVMIYRTIPTRNQQAADVVLGQENFTSIKRLVTDNRSFRGPQGVWVQNGRLFVADTQNHRVLIWNSIPTQNHQAADIVLGQPNFNVAPEVDLAKQRIETKADSMLNPVSVTSDGVRLFVSDLGHNRVLIWNSIPTRNAQPADVVIGQPDMTAAIANNARALCPSSGLNPVRCNATLDFPRFALSDGRRLFVSDGGNDRILIFNQIPTQNGARADVILGQLSDTLNLTTDNPDGPEAFPNRATAADRVRTPGALAWDPVGNNLYVADPYNRRVLVYSPAEPKVPPTGVRNSASREIFAVGAVTFSGTLKENDEVTLKINGKEYKHKVVKKTADDRDFNLVIRDLVTQINAGDGDPNVLAIANFDFLTLVLTARVAGEDGNKVTLESSLSTGATIVATTSGATLQGGQDAAAIAPGALVAILGEDLADGTATSGLTFPPAPQTQLPTELGGVQVYFDGIRAPIVSVSPTQIIAQMPWEVVDSSSVTGWVRSRRANGSVTVSTAVSVPLIQQNPGIFAEDGPDPRPGLVYHSSSYGIATVSVDGTANANDTVSILINDRRYTYRVASGDTLVKVRDGLINEINKDGGDPEVVAFAAGAFTRIRLRSRVEGPAGNGISIRVDTSSGAQAIMTAFNSQTCCANRSGARVTDENPAIPGETITVYATGLGLVKPTDAAGRNDKLETVTGVPYSDRLDNVPVEFVSSLAGARTANVIFARLIPGTVGLYEVQLELNTDLPSNPRTQLTIAQSFQVSNIITFPVVRPESSTP